MPFPVHDAFWVQTSDFLKRHVTAGESVIAPVDFVQYFDHLYTYDAPAIDRSLSFDWVVVHKGLIHLIPGTFLRRVVRTIPAVFANEVFVVFHSGPGVAVLNPKSAHFKALRVNLETARLPDFEPGPDARLHPFNVAALDIEGVRQMMNERFRKVGKDHLFSGYEHPYLWDRVRFSEVDRLVEKFLAPVEGLDVLEVGCGLGRHIRFFKGEKSYLGIDLSDVAIERARGEYGQTPSRSFAVMDVMDLELEDARFDLVLGVEMIEHVHDVDKMLHGIQRVLRPGGRFIFNSINNDSLNRRMLRRMGFPEFLGTTEHFREFGYARMNEILHRHGFGIFQAEGILLLPYYNLPGMSPEFQKQCLDDVELVEEFRLLGERAGPEFGFEFIISAVKK